MLSPALKAFLGGGVRSVWAVELLLVLRRPPGSDWSAEELVRELRGSPLLVADILASFQVMGLVRESEPGRYSYGPASPTLGALCDELEREYRLKPVAVVSAIASGSESRVRGLADAFRFKERDK